MVEVFAWNPRRPLFRNRFGRLLPIRRSVNNFGDLLGPMVVKRMLEQKGISSVSSMYRGEDVRLLTIGSVLHFAREGDVVWGAGVNGKVASGEYRFSKLRICAVRGPLTRDFLMGLGMTVPKVFGDPALLLPALFPKLRDHRSHIKYDLTLVPNLNDFKFYRRHPCVLNPTSNLDNCLQRIARSKLVVGSSLHGLVVAEALGIPARAVRSDSEHPLKYADYYLGTGRKDFKIAKTVTDAVRLGGEPPLKWSGERLLAAFPYDLWQPSLSAIEGNI